jgi:hypothetical protein
LFMLRFHRREKPIRTWQCRVQIAGIATEVVEVAIVGHGWEALLLFWPARSLAGGFIASGV